MKNIESPLIVIIGNKLDLDRNVSIQEGEELAKKEGTLFYEISSKTNENIGDCIFEVISHFPYFTQFKTNKKKLVQELKAENVDGLQSDSSPNEKNLKPNLKQSKCQC